MLKRRNTSSDPGSAKRPRLDSGATRQDVVQDNVPQTTSTPLATRPPERTSGPPKSHHNKGKGKGSLQTSTTGDATQNRRAANSSGRREIINKLAPPRPFPTVPSSVSANGPKSSHREGKNHICITRHTTLAAYLNRCKKLLVDDGYQLLHLYAMGAAIPHLLTLSVSLPPILPFARDEITVEVRTGTIEVVDEIIPEDEDEDMSLRTRGKGSVSVMIQIGDGRKSAPTITRDNRRAQGSRGKGKKPEIVIIPELDQEDDEMDGGP